jgi:phosphatidylethanolamine-binding protein (PEBP) family uncharacterized protein
VLPTEYTCDGRDTPPPIEWGAVPATTASLVLFVVGFSPNPATNSYTPSVEWTVAGINPDAHKLDAGRLPAGAFVGISSRGGRRYSICPKRGVSERYQFELWGLPEKALLAPHYAGAPVLVSLIPRKGKTLASARGGFAVTYKRL